MYSSVSRLDLQNIKYHISNIKYNYQVKKNRVFSNIRIIFLFLDRK